ncbi:hypothetical protein N0V82_000756 [Gnomoniopsis sp. IMI 355080]|nr:hypothetical protein N0V82_000756 [Gnomoniopsis sp. IMI 355080]
MAILEVSNEYGYVLLVAGFTSLVNQWHGVQTVRARKASGIGYPNTYATAEQAEKDPAAYQLNCAQRAHANFTENLAPFITNLLIAGLRLPVPAAVAGAVWLTSRVVYTKGYLSSAGPKGRTT